MSPEPVLIIGAGPFGLSVSAHLHARGLDHVLVGRPMDTWRAHMPAGMKLRSEPYGSDLAAPRRGHDVRAYCAERGLDYVHRLGPLGIEPFLDYADWYTDALVPAVTDATVTEVVARDGGFRVCFADAAAVSARQVVVATGVLPYATMPAPLDGLPAHLASHTSDHHDLTRFRGQHVAVVGGGQSALETAALLHEAGAVTQVIARTPALNWLTPNPAEVRGPGYLRRPVNKLCEGWHCAFWNTPEAFRLLPQEMRLRKARSVLGPAGAWWLKDRVDGVVEVLTGQHVQQAHPRGSGVQLTLQGPGGSQRRVQVDHVVAGTGFTVDVARLAFLPERLRAGLRLLNGYPVVDRAGQSSIPGLFFAGAPAAVSLGPSVRFIAGTHTSVRPLARAVARGAKAAGRAERGEPQPMPSAS
jgi:FAD-dependent urate hydroxylase